MFHCLPSNTKCEWIKLRSFVKQFNDKFNTDYTLAKCLDVFDRNGKQPEILLDCPNKKSMVIEHKVIVCPNDYLKFHRTEHEFGDFFFERLDLASFKDNLYILELNSKQLRGNKREIKKMAHQIADSVAKYHDRIVETGGIKSSIPIPWIFREIINGEVDEDAPDVGVGIQFVEPSVVFDAHFEELLHEARAGLLSQLEKKLNDTSVKFQNYADCLKILVIEVHGDSDLLIGNDIEELLKVVKIPSNIDQIWSTEQSFFSESNYDVLYDQIYQDMNLKE